MSISCSRESSIIAFIRMFLRISTSGYPGMNSLRFVNAISEVFRARVTTSSSAAASRALALDSLMRHSSSKVVSLNIANRNLSLHLPPYRDWDAI